MSIKKIGIVFWLFMVIYCPIFGGINTTYITGIFSWIYILCFYQKPLTSMKSKWAIRLYMCLGGILLYGLINSLINMRIARHIISQVVFWGVFVFPSLFLISNKCIDIGINDERKFVKLLLVVGNIQGIISLFLFFSPEIRHKYLSLLAANGQIREGLLNQAASYRFYGISLNIITYMPLVQIVLALLAVWLYINTREKKYILSFPLLVFSAVINARTPVVILAIGIILLVLFMNHNWRELLHALRILVVVLLGIVFFYNVLRRIGTAYTQWLSKGITFIVETIQGNRNYTTETGLSFVAPKDITVWLVGIGSTIIDENPYGQTADMGYANYIWVGGILYVIILSLIYFLIGRRMVRMRISSFIVAILYMTILVFSYKMPILHDNEFMRLFYAIYIWSIVNSYRSNQDNAYQNKEKCLSDMPQ